MTAFTTHICASTLTAFGQDGTTYQLLLDSVATGLAGIHVTAHDTAPTRHSLVAASDAMAPTDALAPTDTVHNSGNALMFTATTRCPGHTVRYTQDASNSLVANWSTLGSTITMRRHEQPVPCSDTALVSPDTLTFTTTFRHTGDTARKSLVTTQEVLAPTNPTNYLDTIGHVGDPSCISLAETLEHAHTGHPSVAPEATACDSLDDTSEFDRPSPASDDEPTLINATVDPLLDEVHSDATCTTRAFH